MLVIKKCVAVNYRRMDASSDDYRGDWIQSPLLNIKRFSYAIARPSDRGELLGSISEAEEDAEQNLE